MDAKPYTFGSLFAGIGGFDLGFERAGFQCQWQVEIDDYATRILERHWPGVHRERDIKQCGRHNLEPVDCIIGGFPCQDISYAGKGAGLEGARSGLFFEAVRLVCELRPRAVVLENVAGLLTRGLDRVLGTLAEVGFDAEWHCIPAAAVGAPHIRDRVFVLAYSASERYGLRRIKRDVCEKNGGQVGQVQSKSAIASAGGKRANVADRKSHGWHEGKSDLRWRSEGVSQGAECGLGCCSKDASNANGERLERQRKVASRIIKEQQDACYEGWWATEPNVGRVANGIPARVDRLRCLGNAIVPQVAEVVARMVLDRLQPAAAGNEGE